MSQLIQKIWQPKFHFFQPTALVYFAKEKGSSSASEDLETTLEEVWQEIKALEESGGNSERLKQLQSLLQDLESQKEALAKAKSDNKEIESILGTITDLTNDFRGKIQGVTEVPEFNIVSDASAPQLGSSDALTALTAASDLSAAFVEQGSDQGITRSQFDAGGYQNASTIITVSNPEPTSIQSAETSEKKTVSINFNAIVAESSQNYLDQFTHLAEGDKAVLRAHLNEIIYNGDVGMKINADGQVRQIEVIGTDLRWLKDLKGLENIATQSELTVSVLAEILAESNSISLYDYSSKSWESVILLDKDAIVNFEWSLLLTCKNGQISFLKTETEEEVESNIGGIQIDTWNTDDEVDISIPSSSDVIDDTLFDFWAEDVTSNEKGLSKEDLDKLVESLNWNPLPVLEFEADDEVDISPVLDWFSPEFKTETQEALQGIQVMLSEFQPNVLKNIFAKIKLAELSAILLLSDDDFKETIFQVLDRSIYQQVESYRVVFWYPTKEEIGQAVFKLDWICSVEKNNLDNSSSNDWNFETAGDDWAALLAWWGFDAEDLPSSDWEKQAYIQNLNLNEADTEFLLAHLADCQFFKNGTIHFKVTEENLPELENLQGSDMIVFFDEVNVGKILEIRPNFSKESDWELIPAPTSDLDSDSSPVLTRTSDPVLEPDLDPTPTPTPTPEITPEEKLDEVDLIISEVKTKINELTELLKADGKDYAEKKEVVTRYIEALVEHFNAIESAFTNLPDDLSDEQFEQVNQLQGQKEALLDRFEELKKIPYCWEIANRLEGKAVEIEIQPAINVIEASLNGVKEDLTQAEESARSYKKSLEKYAGTIHQSADELNQLHKTILAQLNKQERMLRSFEIRRDSSKNADLNRQVEEEVRKLQPEIDKLREEEKAIRKEISSLAVRMREVAQDNRMNFEVLDNPPPEAPQAPKSLGSRLLSALKFWS